MCVSNEPCADKADDSRWELAHNRMAVGLAAYGECRDSSQTLCVCEPVGMANASSPKPQHFEKLEYA